jgi:hypothetical protein
MGLIQSGVSSDLLTVDSISKAARETPYDTYGNTLAVTAGAQANPSVTGIPTAGVSNSIYRIQKMDKLGNSRVGFDQVLFRDTMEGSTINIATNWISSTGTFTQAQASTTGINFNSGNSTASGAYSILTTQKQFMKNELMPISCKVRARYVPQTNAVMEMGFCQPSGTTAQLTNGAVWRVTSSGSLVPVLIYNGSDVVQGSDASSQLSSSNYYTYIITVDDELVRFTILNAFTGAIINEQTLQIPVSQPKMWGVTHLPFAARLYTTSSCSSVPSLFISDVAVLSYDVVTNKLWQHQLICAYGAGAEWNPTKPSITTSNANYVYNAGPASASLNTSTPSYTTMGGQWQFAAYSGSENNYPLFGYTVPAPYTFILTGIRISTINTGAAVASTPTTLSWSIIPNMPTGALGAQTPVIPVGIQSFIVGAAVGAAAPDIDITFDAPIKTEGGKVLIIGMKQFLGTATSNQIVRGTVQLRGYFE